MFSTDMKATCKNSAKLEQETKTTKIVTYRYPLFPLASSIVLILRYIHLSLSAMSYSHLFIVLFFGIDRENKADVRPPTPPPPTPPRRVARLFIVPSQLTHKKTPTCHDVALQRFEPARVGPPLRARHGRGKL